MWLTDTDGSGVPNVFDFDLFVRAIWDFLFGTGPIEAVQSWFGLGYGDAFHWVSLLGDTWGIMLALGVALWVYGRDTTYALLGAIVLGAVSKAFMSAFFSVPRPSGPDIMVYKNVPISSFPSGHVYQSLIPWGVLYMKERIPLLLPVLVVLTVSVTRLYLGLHYLADVLFAILFGALFVWIYIRLLPYMADWFYRRSVSFYAALTVAASSSVLASVYILVDTARRWEIVGLVLGAGTALILEHCVVQYSPPRRNTWRLTAIGIGLSGLLVYAVAGMQLQESWRLAYLALSFAVMLWTLLAVPILVQRLRRLV